MHPTLFHIFGVAIHSYSLLLIVSFFCATRLAVYVAGKRAPVDSDRLMELAMFSILWGLLGGRLFYVLQHPETYFQAPLQILNLREGGMTILGGIITPALAMLVTARRQGFDARNVLDVYAAPLLLGMAIGRIGCVLHGCCYGNVCDASFPLALTYPQANGMPLGPRYPTQLFETVADLCLMAVLIWLLPRIVFAGQAAWIAISGYGMIRFVNEFARADGRELVSGGVTVGQLIALGLFLLGLAGALGLLGKPPIDNTWQVAKDT